ncbi:hypothetical protein D3C71_1514260 [compost metagenome]
MAQLASCLKSTVVCLPTLKVSQLRTALSPVCRISTFVRPSATVCVGALARSHPAVSVFVSTFRPPSARPSGTSEGALAAALRAASCAACCAAMPRAARFRLPSERLSCSLAFCCCTSGLVSEEAGMPLGSRPVCEAMFCMAPLSANHAGLNARCACALLITLPAANINAMARAIGAIRKT